MNASVTVRFSFLKNKYAKPDFVIIVFLNLKAREPDIAICRIVYVQLAQIIQVNSISPLRDLK